jgi:hypothetical protein
MAPFVELVIHSEGSSAPLVEDVPHTLVRMCQSFLDVIRVRPRCFHIHAIVQDALQADEHDRLSAVVLDLDREDGQAIVEIDQT